MTRTLPPSVAARRLLRSAIRQHPEAQRALNGQDVSTLNRAGLLQIARTLGIDVDAIMSGRMATPAPTRAARNPVPPATPNDLEDSTMAPDATDQDDANADPALIEGEIQAIRGLILSGGFGALDQRLRDLIVAAHKPAERIEVLVPGPALPAPVAGQTPIHVARPTGAELPWSKAFGVRGTLGARLTKVWDASHPDTPRLNSKYIWPQPATSLVLTQIARGRNVLLWGPAGTGKTEFASQIAAKTGRPFALISCDSSTDGPTLVGMTVPHENGVTWQDGQLTRAIQTPGCVICLDEPSVARPGALFVLQNVLANRMLFIGETGRRIKVAEGVLFIATDNTNGMGGGGRKGYTDTNRLNAAFLDRFGVRVKFDYMPPDKEAEIIVSYVPGCTRALADLLVSAAVTTRAAADQQTLSHGIGLRRLLAWAECLVDGIDAESAFNAAILNCAAEQDVETLRQQCLLAYDKKTVANAIADTGTVITSGAPLDPPDPSDTNPTPQGRSAASDFRLSPTA